MVAMIKTLASFALQSIGHVVLRMHHAVKVKRLAARLDEAITTAFPRWGVSRMLIRRRTGRNNKPNGRHF